MECLSGTYATLDLIEPICALYREYWPKKLVVTKAYYDSLPDGDYGTASVESNKVQLLSAEVCAAVKKVAPEANIQDECFNRSIVFFTQQYEAKLKEAAIRLNN